MRKRPAPMDAFRTALPAVWDWIEATLVKHEKTAVPAGEFDFPRLRQVFPPALLSRAKAVIVPGSVPFPPLSRMGLQEFELFERMPMAGITYKDTFFVGRPHQTERLFFHEMIHVLQWERLGVDDFLLTYAAGLMEFGYRDCPLEQMAYSLEDRFDQGTLREGIVEFVGHGTDTIYRNFLGKTTTLRRKTTGGNSRWALKRY